jgi:hypothetical protein
MSFINIVTGIFAIVKRVRTLAGRRTPLRGLGVGDGRHSFQSLNGPMIRSKEQ